MTKFYLQQGHGMKTLNNEFVEQNQGSSVILSARNCTPKQAESQAKDLHSRHAEVLFDPQFYEPRTGLSKILDYPYWSNFSFDTIEFTTQQADNLCDAIIKYQVEKLNVDAVIIPGRYTNAITDEWLDMHYKFVEYTSKLKLQIPVYMTVALGPDIILNRTAFDRLINEIINYPVDGFYFISKRPNGKFLVSDDTYIYNKLNGLLSISLAGKKIIHGYCNQQSLIYASVGVTGIASGNFRNVRGFDPATFDVAEESDQRRATWYYDANTLSEFRAEALRLAYQRGMSGSFGPVCKHCKPLIEAKDPSAVPWTENPAFRHYLHELNRQWLDFASVQLSHRLDYTISFLETVKTRIDEFTEKGVRLGERSFNPVLDATLSALVAFKSDRGSELKYL